MWSPPETEGWIAFLSTSPLTQLSKNKSRGSVELVVLICRLLAFSRFVRNKLYRQQHRSLAGTDWLERWSDSKTWKNRNWIQSDYHCTADLAASSWRWNSTFRVTRLQKQGVNWLILDDKGVSLHCFARDSLKYSAEKDSLRNAIWSKAAKKDMTIWCWLRIYNISQDTFQPVYQNHNSYSSQSQEWRNTFTCSTRATSSSLISTK